MPQPVECPRERDQINLCINYFSHFCDRVHRIRAGEGYLGRESAYWGSQFTDTVGPEGDGPMAGV